MQSARQYVKPIQIPSLYRFGVIPPTKYNSIWAGYEAYSTQNSNEPFYCACAAWCQPRYVTSGDRASLWTGIGDGNAIFQAGACSDANVYGGSAPYEFWVEDYPLGSVYEAAPALKAGDTAFAQIQYQGSKGYIFLEDETTGQYTNINNFSVPYYTSAYVEWIDEEQNFSNWGPANMWGCGYSTVINGGCTLFNNLNIYEIINDGDPHGHEVVPTSPGSNANFTFNTN